MAASLIDFCVAFCLNGVIFDFLLFITRIFENVGLDHRIGSAVKVGLRLGGPRGPKFPAFGRFGKDFSKRSVLSLFGEAGRRK